MPFTSHARLAGALLPSLAEAARVILSTREQGLVVDRKSDNSPVTEADHRAEAILTRAINDILPGLPIVAEESSAAGSAPPIGTTFFLLDPLDGTRDYCAGRDDFTINVGLVDEGRPVFGLIYAPAPRELYLTSAPGEAVAASFDCTSPRALSDLDSQIVHVRTGQTGRLSALVSRREAGPEFDDRLQKLGVISRTPMSSAIKFGRLVRGDADVYPRFGPTCEWDTAAGQAIVEAAGGTVTALDGSPMIYGKSAAKFLNGPFVARGRNAD
ncbi:MAG: 3'(2'),5'-bisphosphate nucleotidase CysQ [Hyphomicrobium sp.]|nr:3'(2'),5'-bisphosphate nucleotidase CysQ [Hyphomicrobium sp.]